MRYGGLSYEKITPARGHRRKTTVCEPAVSVFDICTPPARPEFGQYLGASEPRSGGSPLDAMKVGS